MKTCEHGQAFGHDNCPGPKWAWESDEIYERRVKTLPILVRLAELYKAGFITREKFVEMARVI